MDADRITAAESKFRSQMRDHVTRCVGGSVDVAGGYFEQKRTLMPGGLGLRCMAALPVRRLARSHPPRRGLGVDLKWRQFVDRDAEREHLLGGFETLVCLAEKLAGCDCLGLGLNVTKPSVRLFLCMPELRM